MKRCLMLAVALFTAVPVQATTLLDVGGKQDNIFTIAPDTAAAVAFTLSKAQQDVSLKAPVVCLGCLGSMYLNKGSIGASASLSSTLHGEAFNTSATASSFDLGDLDAGTYFLILSVKATSTASAYWVGSSAPLATSDGAVRNSDFTTGSLTSFVPNSDFKVRFGLGLNYTLTTPDAAAAVPEPATWFTMSAGLGLVGAGMRRRARNVGTKRPA